MMRSQPPSPSDVMSSVSGASDSSSNAWPCLRNALAGVGPGLFPPQLVVEIKALACELPATRGLPLSRLSTADIVRETQRCGLVATISDKTVWRWLHEDAIRPWQHRTWIFPRDPEFGVKAGRILDLYARRYDGSALAPDEFVISADEKTSIQARLRCHPSTPPQPRQPCAWSMSTSAAAPGPTSRRWRCTARSCSAAVSTRPALSRFSAWSPKSCP